VVVALSFAITIVALLKVLGRIFVMVLLCHSRDFGCSCPSFAFSFARQESFGDAQHGLRDKAR
jgi:hypothetical protein